MITEACKMCQSSHTMSICYGQKIDTQRHNLMDIFCELQLLPEHRRDDGSISISGGVTSRCYETNETVAVSSAPLNVWHQLAELPHPLRPVTVADLGENLVHLIHRQHPKGGLLGSNHTNFNVSRFDVRP